ncbi:MAG TPA: alpha/beta hydrolase, partial [Acidimicrobiia bacterium]
MSAESKFADTDRLRIHYLASGPADGEPVILIHGNLATGRFMEGILEDLPKGYRGIAPDMRGFGDTEPQPIDATRGLRDWADDIHALVQALAITQPIHLVGWSTGGAAIASYTIDRPDRVRSITFIDPVSPYGFGSTKDSAGAACFDDYAGSGGGGVVPEFVERLA